MFKLLKCSRCSINNRVQCTLPIWYGEKVFRKSLILIMHHREGKQTFTQTFSGQQWQIYLSKKCQHVFKFCNDCCKIVCISCSLHIHPQQHTIYALFPDLKCFETNYFSHIFQRCITATGGGVVGGGGWGGGWGVGGGVGGVGGGWGGGGGGVLRSINLN